MDPTQNPTIPAADPGVQTPSAPVTPPAEEPVANPEPQAPVVTPTEGTGDAGTGVPPTTPPAAV